MPKFTSKESLKIAIKNYFNGLDTSDISNWDTSEITDMSHLFYGISQLSVEPITLNWNTSNVWNMSWMFCNCKQDFILNFRRHSGGCCHMAATDHSAVGNECLTALCDTSNVTNMGYMFLNAINFNQPLNFNTCNVKNMEYMFSGAINFNQPLYFHTSNVINMTAMFYNATNFNQPLHFNTKNIIDICWIFYKATNFDQPIYFQLNDKYEYTEIFKYSPMQGQESKYLLKPAFYNKLFVMYALNQINPELLYLLDEFEEFF